MFALSTCRTAVSPFHPSALDIAHASSPNPGGRVVSAPLPSLSACPLKGLQFYAWAEFPQTLKIVRGPKATHQLASPISYGTVHPINIGDYFSSFPLFRISSFSRYFWFESLCTTSVFSTPLRVVFIERFISPSKSPRIACTSSDGCI